MRPTLPLNDPRSTFSIVASPTQPLAHIPTPVPVPVLVPTPAPAQISSSMHLLPPNNLRAIITPAVFDLKHAPDVTLVHPNPYVAISERNSNGGRRRFLSTCAGLLGMMTATTLSAAMVFEMDRVTGEGLLRPQTDSQLNEPKASLILPAHVQAPQERLALGEIPEDFWERPRSLRLQRQGSSLIEEVVYWKDGNLIPEGYWKACHVLRDVRAGMMTYMDPSLLDLLRGITGYYEAWNWKFPIIITSGYRTEATNNKLSKEGAAKNSMHLYGKAADLYMERIPVEHLMLLGKHFQRGGVGFYPSRGFIHLDTGKVRAWKGR